MIRVHLGADWSRVRIAARPAPLHELHAAFLTLATRGDALHGRWRRQVLRALPPSAAALGDLVPAGHPPGFLDVPVDTVTGALDLMHGTDGRFVRSEPHRVHAAAGTPARPWVRELADGDPRAWQQVLRAERAAYAAVVAPVWDVVQDLYRAEFTRHALVLAEHGLGAALLAAVPGVGPVIGVDALAQILGRTRAGILLVLGAERTTGDLARAVGVSLATASEHVTALRGAGLVRSRRDGRAVLCHRTPLGDLLVGRGTVRPDA